MKIEDEIDILVKQMKAMKNSQNKPEDPCKENIHVSDSVHIIEIPQEDVEPEIEEDSMEDVEPIEETPEVEITCDENPDIEIEDVLSIEENE